MYSFGLFFFSCIVMHKCILISTHQNYYEKSFDFHRLEGCICDSYSCGCCTHMEVSELNINDTACICLGVDPFAYSIEFVITLDNRALINATVSARNPPPVCLPIPYIESAIDACVHFHDLDIRNGSFHGCVDLEIDISRVFRVAGYKLGCWDTKHPNLKLTDSSSQLNESVIIVGASSEVRDYFKDRVTDFTRKDFIFVNETVVVYRDHFDNVIGMLRPGDIVSNSYQHYNVCSLINDSSVIKSNMFLLLVLICLALMLV